MVGDVVTGALFALIAGLYGAQFLLYFKLGGMVADVEANAEQAARNTVLIHDHIVVDTNPPASNDCELCEKRELSQPEL